MGYAAPRADREGDEAIAGGVTLACFPLTPLKIPPVFRYVEYARSFQTQINLQPGIFLAVSGPRILYRLRSACSPGAGNLSSHIKKNPAFYGGTLN